MAPHLITTLGPRPAAALELILPHEHIFVDLRTPDQPGYAQAEADDVLRLLAYEAFIPRSVLVEYLKTLFAFHIGLYHLRIIKLLPALLRRRGADPICAPRNCPVAPIEIQAHGACPYRIHLLVDFGNDLDSHMSDLARQSADVHYRRIPNYVAAHYLVRKLDELERAARRKIPARARLSRR